jgi:dynein heavy chain, axonemal
MSHCRSSAWGKGRGVWQRAQSARLPSRGIGYAVNAVVLLTPAAFVHVATQAVCGDSAQRDRQILVDLLPGSVVLTCGVMMQVCLQNCHLAASWMPQLAGLVRDLQSRTDVHSKFRLWIASEPFAAFPVSVLKASIKAVLEPPRSVKANVTSALAIIPEDISASFANGSHEWRSLIYSTALFHGVVQERRKFGALGWNIPTEFAAEDLLCSLRSMHSLLQVTKASGAAGTMPLEAFRRIAGEINYGGRVTDDIDRAVVVALLDKHLRRGLDVAPVGEGTGKLKGGMPAKCSKVADLLELADLLPDADGPGAFGLHPNADLTFQLQVSRTLART